MQTPSNRSSAAASFVTYGLLLILVGATIFVYARGLHGPFLLDDSIHITQNRWVKIDSLSWSNLSRAWDSSFSAFPSNRPWPKSALVSTMRLPVWTAGRSKPPISRST